MMKFLRSVGYGVAGIVHVVRSEANMRWHVLAMVTVIAAGLFFRITLGEWTMVVACIGLVLACECINTSLERLANRVTTDHDPLIRESKDAAAAAVLIVSVAAGVIGLIIFVPKVWAMFG